MIKNKFNATLEIISVNCVTQVGPKEKKIKPQNRSK